MDICPKCGLPKEACVCEGIARTEQKIKIGTIKKRYGKIVTQITGMDPSIDMKQVAKKLKTELACGGTVKNDAIELQGDHRKKAKEILAQLGFPAEIIA